MLNYFRRLVNKGELPNQNQATTVHSKNNYLVELNQVVKVYDTPAGPFTALKNIDLKVAPGEFVAVIGKSGSGKSTLINMITGIDHPTVGEVYVANTPLHALPEGAMARWRGRNLGVIFQFFQLLPTLTLVENIILPMELCNLYTAKERHEQAMHLLEMVGIADQADKFPSAISGGQQQRVAIARSLANDPDILVADEPTGNLDTKTSDSIFEIFTNFVTQGKTILMVTHDRDLASRVNRVVLIADGEIVDQLVSEALPTLDEKELVKFLSRLEPAIYPAGSIIFRQGEPADKFYIIVKGQVDVVLAHASGTEVVTAQLGKGQHFGEAGLLENATRSATVRVSSDDEVSLMAIDQASFNKLVSQSQLTSEAIVTLMRQHTTTNYLMQVLTETLPEASGQSKFDHKFLHFQPGEIIVRQGDIADNFYMINKGKVDIMSSHNESEPIAQLVSGQYFGEMGLLQRGKRANTVRAALNSETEIELIMIGQETFHQLMQEGKIVKDEIVVTMHHRLASSLSDSED